VQLYNSLTKGEDVAMAVRIGRYGLSRADKKCTQNVASGHLDS
jgi:hypothetical protein